MIFSIPLHGWLQALLVLGLALSAAWPLGQWMARLYGDAPLPPFAARIEKAVFTVCGVQNAPMHWREYAKSLLGFSLVGTLVLFGVLWFQDILPLNPAHIPALSSSNAFNTAASFVTNTNWQSYVPEQQMSLFAQASGLAVQNFISAAVGLAVMAAVMRGFASKNTKTIGNFWVDMTRSVLFVLLPLSLLLALVLGINGVPQTLHTPTIVQTLEGETQTIALGPVASQVAIKQLGTNGGGFFNANGAHPLENPTPLTNFLQMFAMILLPIACCFCFGTRVGDKRQGFAILAAMLMILLPLLFFAMSLEQRGNPLLGAANMEGKEVRFGAAASALWAVLTTATSTGAVNASHDAMMPMTGMVSLLLMQMGEVVLGGTGSGLYGMMVFVLLAVFIGGLMVGRTPEYLGKKIGVFEIKMACLVMLLPAFLVLLGTALAVVVFPEAASAKGAHKFSQILYGFTSASNNNGSAFGGLDANSIFYNIILGVCMLLARFLPILALLALAGAVAAKNTTPLSVGTLPTHTPLFVSLLVGVILLIGVLTYIPALALGPIAAHFSLVGAL